MASPALTLPPFQPSRQPRSRRGDDPRRSVAIHPPDVPIHHHRDLRAPLRSVDRNTRVSDPAAAVTLRIVPVQLPGPWYLLRLCGYLDAR